MIGFERWTGRGNPNVAGGIGGLGKAVSGALAKEECVGPGISYLYLWHASVIQVSYAAKPLRHFLWPSRCGSQVTEMETFYRRSREANTWHYCRNCYSWPLSDYEEKTNQDPPISGFCLNCIESHREERCEWVHKEASPNWLKKS